MMPVLDHLADFSGEDERRLEAIFEAFEVAWLEGPRPRIADHLPEAEALRRAALVELVYIDQEYAIRADPLAKVEDYLGPFPELADDADLLADLLAREFRLRRLRGDVPTTDEYLARFPRLADRLEVRLKVETDGPARPAGESTIESDGKEPGSETLPLALPSEQDPRYDGLRFHARGGLGDVYRARDVELSREVALKRIRLKYSSESRVRRRFLREARLTARLSHPGVVPIHGLIWDGQGQPWYVMRFVEGRTLALAIEEYHQPADPKPSLEDRALAFRKLLARYVAVCDTIAFAHSRDVVHRDLKPANVILGEYGETIVLDWGLATSTSAGQEDQPAPRPNSPEEEADSLTHAGQVLGTPAFMSPEQAKGLPAMNRPASDIYGLGAILYTILTGVTPFEPQGWGSLQGKIVQGLYPSPSKVNSETPRALEAICHKAMALDPLDRYESGNALARDVERWAADEAVTAWREPPARRARRWAKKHRTAVTTAASMAMVAALLIGGFARLRLYEQQRADASALAIFANADGLAIQARSSGDSAKLDQAITEGLRARERLESGGSLEVRRDVAYRLEILKAEQARLREKIVAEQRDRRMVSTLEEASTRGITKLKGRYFDNQSKQEAYLAAFRGYGIDIASLSIEDSAKRIRSSKISENLIAALDDWPAFGTENVPNSKLWDIGRAAEVDPIRAAIRDSQFRHDVARLRGFCEREEDRVKLGPRLRSVFNALIHVDPVGSFPLLEVIRRENPSDFLYNLKLAEAHQQASPPRYQERLRCISVAAALRPESAGVHGNLGHALAEVGEYDAAIAEHRTAVRLQPDSYRAHSHLGLALESRGDLPGAIVEHRESIRLEPKDPWGYIHLGNALSEKGDQDEAIREYQTAVELDPGISEIHLSIGNALMRKGDLNGSLAEHKIAVQLKPNLDGAHYSLAILLNAKGDREGAMTEYRTAIGLNPNFAEAHTNLGIALDEKGDRAGAMAEYRLAIHAKPNLAEPHHSLAHALSARGDHDEAISEYQLAIRYKPNRAFSHIGLGQALSAKGNHDAAIAEYRLASRLEPRLAEPHYSLGIIFGNKGDLDSAIAEYRLAIEKNPNYAEAHCNLGQMLENQGFYSEALIARERGHELGSKRRRWTYPSAQWVADCRRLALLEKKIPEMLEGAITSEDPDESLEMAGICLKKKCCAKATWFFGRAFDQKPALAENLNRGSRYTAARAAILAVSQQGKDAPPPDEASRTKLREQGLGWLRADLAAREKSLEGGEVKDRQMLVKTLSQWKMDRDLLGIREEASLAKLPVAEREAFQKLWADVEALRRKAAGDAAR